MRPCNGTCSHGTCVDGWCSCEPGWTANADLWPEDAPIGCPSPLAWLKLLWVLPTPVLLVVSVLGCICMHEQWTTYSVLRRSRRASCCSQHLPLAFFVSFVIFLIPVATALCLVKVLSTDLEESVGVMPAATALHGLWQVAMIITFGLHSANIAMVAYRGNELLDSELQQLQDEVFGARLELALISCIKVATALLPVITAMAGEGNYELALLCYNLFFARSAAFFLAYSLWCARVARGLGEAFDRHIERQLELAAKSGTRELWASAQSLREAKERAVGQKLRVAKLFMIELTVHLLFLLLPAFRPYVSWLFALQANLVNLAALDSVRVYMRRRIICPSEAGAPCV